MRPFLNAVIISGFALALIACASDKGSPAAQPGNSGTSLAEQLIQLDLMPAPEGVSAARWKALKQSLRRILENSAAKSVQAAPVSPASAARLSLDSGTLTLSWGYACQGDYDQNSEVNIADLGPVGVHFGESSGGGPFPPGSSQSMIDGDGNGEINIADLSPIGINFGRRVSEYHVYRSTNFDDVPTSATGPNGPTAELIGTVPFGDGTGIPTQQQLQFSFVLPDIRLGWFYWVRPADADTEGTVSNLVSFDGSLNNLAPIAALSADPLSGPAQLEVSFDASGSSDPDGDAQNISDLIQFVWDFGEGSAFETTSVPTISHTYRNAGTFDARVTVTDRRAGTGEAGISISVQGGNAPPVAQIDVQDSSIFTGSAGRFEFHDSADDGGLENCRIEFDFEGTGSFVEVPNTNGVFLFTTLHTYATAGTFEAVLRVTDQNGTGLSDTDSVTIVVTDPGANHTPVADVRLVGASVVDAPAVVTFDLSNCSDEDGNLDIVLFDANGGDGDEESSAAFPVDEVSVTFTTGGRYELAFLVIDDLGAFDRDVVEVQVNDAGHAPPVAAYSTNPDPPAGESVLSVQFDASGSTATGSVARYQWAFGLDPFFSVDGGSNPVIDHDFTQGTHQIRLKVTDNDGLVAFFRGADVVVTADDPPPLAQLSIERISSSFPEGFQFDASASSDPGGSIVEYEWDFDGDGIFEVSSGNESVQSHTYFSQGTLTPALRVTDNLGQTGTASGTELTISTGWLIESLEAGSRLSDTSITTVTAGISSRFAVAYGYSTKEAEVRTVSTSFSTDWTSPQVVFSDPDSNDAQPNVVILDVADRPALFFPFHLVSGFGATGYARAENFQGFSWPGTNPGQCDDGENSLDAMVMGGFPASVRGNSSRFDVYIAEDELGDSWPCGSGFEEFGFDVPGGFFIRRLKTVETSSGLPAVAMVCEHGSGANTPALLFNAARVASGKDWRSGDVTSVDSQVTSGTDIRPGAVRFGNTDIGELALAYWDANPSQLSFVRSNNSLGSSWETPIKVFDGSESYKFIDLEILGGTPAIVWLDARAQDDVCNLMFVRAFDAGGTSWDKPQLIDSGANTGFNCSMAVKGRTVAISYITKVTSSIGIVRVAHFTFP